ncbi:MAG: hypothetical protein ACR2ID_09815 [Chthoniobacterales bacterium]
MRRSIVLVFVAAMAALGIWFGLRAPSSKSAGSEVAALLPAETVALLHLPDFSRTRSQWHQSELYKLWREPELQEFLQKPLAGRPAMASAEQKVAQLDQLQIKDAFLAITSWENQQLKMAAGCRFKGTAADAEKVIGIWRARLPQDTSKFETVTYQRHQIDVITRGTLTFAKVLAGNWFLAANDLETLQRLLDRIDQRTNDPASTLQADASFAAALKHMPAGYALLGYARVDRYLEKLTGALPPDALGAQQLAALREVRSISGATAFEEGRVRDVLFVAMPKAARLPRLGRSSLTLGTKDTFLYMAAVLALADPERLQNLATGNPRASGFLQNMMASFAARGISLGDWKAAFQPELSVLGIWPESTRWPALFASLPVKDAEKARAIVSAITTDPVANPWTATERDGVEYFTQPPSSPMVPVAPTLAVANQLLVLGLDLASVEAAIKRAAPGAGGDLAGEQRFQAAAALVPAPEQSFIYVDTAMLYQRIDAAVRPMLVMAAAFMPAIADTVDLAKLPAADVITRHLTPLVISQNYQDDGYLTSSIGPISVYQAVAGIAGISGAGASFYQRQAGGAAFTGGLPIVPVASPTQAADETP